MLKTVKSVLILLALTAGVAIATAPVQAAESQLTQSQGTVTGVVTDASGPVIGAGVVVKGVSTKGTVIY